MINSNYIILCFLLHIGGSVGHFHRYHDIQNVHDLHAHSHNLHSISPRILMEFKNLFQKLDHNRDNTVTISEASAGLLSFHQAFTPSASAIPVEDYSLNTYWYDIARNTSNFQPGRSCYQTVPDAQIFIDCVVHNTRQFLQSSSSDNHLLPVDFTLELSRYLQFTNCDDIMFANSFNYSCDDVAGIDHVVSDFTHILKELSDHNHIDVRNLDRNNLCAALTERNYCRLSCRVCGLHGDDQASTALKHIIGFRGNDKTSTDYTGVPVLITSDWHVEPWYDASETSTVARYSLPTLDNMWNCFNESIADDPIVPCYLNGVSDPPMDLIASHFDAYREYVSTMYKSFTSNSTVIPGFLFYIGDTQAHSYSGSDIGNVDEPTAISDLMTNALNVMTSYFNAADIFLCPGNNDGPHNAIFTSSDDSVDVADTQAWANSVVSAGIVNNDLGFTYDYPSEYTIHNNTVISVSDTTVTLNQVEFFEKTGYYIKQVDPSNAYGLAAAKLFVISYNTVLGSTNAVQQDAFLTDLSRIQQLGGGVYVFGHHPDITMTLVPDDYESIVKGKFAGHIHVAASTTRSLFTQVAAISQGATDTAFYLGSIAQSSDYEIRLDRRPDLVSYDNDAGAGLLSDPSLWLLS